MPGAQAHRGQADGGLCGASRSRLRTSRGGLERRVKSGFCEACARGGRGTWRGWGGRSVLRPLEGAARGEAQVSAHGFSGAVRPVGGA